MHQIALGYLSVFGLPPVQFIDLAAALDCRHISIFLRGGPLLPLDYPSFSLTKDPALRQEIGAALRGHDVTITLGDGFLVRPDTEIRSFASDLDALAELGAGQINVISLDRDRSRTFDQFGELTELAAQRHIRTVTEPAPGLVIGDIPTALAAVQHVGRPEFQVLVDTMHLIRSGCTPDDLAAIDPDHVGYVQINDTTLQPKIANYLEEAMFERMVPGEGELPLREILAALPADLVIEIEVPQRSLAMAGVSPIDRLRPCVAATRRLLSETQ